MMDLIPINPSDETDIRHKLFVHRVGYRRIIIVEFKGSYGFGSGGNDDAPHMEAAVRAAHAYHPAAIVLDMRKLSYEWGDMMGSPIGAAYVNRVPPTIVVGERCRAGLTSYVQAEMMSDPAKFLFDSLQGAIEASTKWMLWNSKMLDAFYGKLEQAEIEELLQEPDFRFNLLDHLTRSPLTIDAALLKKCIVSQLEARQGGETDYGATLQRSLARLLQLEELEELDFVSDIVSTCEDEEFRKFELRFWGFGRPQLKRLLNGLDDDNETHQKLAEWMQKELDELDKQHRD